MIFNDLNLATGVLPIDPTHAVDAHYSLTVPTSADPSYGSANDYPNDPKPATPPKLTTGVDPSFGSANDYPNDPKPKLAEAPK